MRIGVSQSVALLARASPSNIPRVVLWILVVSLVVWTVVFGPVALVTTVAPLVLLGVMVALSAATYAIATSIVVVTVGVFLLLWSPSRRRAKQWLNAIANSKAFKHNNASALSTRYYVDQRLIAGSNGPARDNNDHVPRVRVVRTDVSPRFRLITGSRVHSRISAA